MLLSDLDFFLGGSGSGISCFTVITGTTGGMLPTDKETPEEDIATEEVVLAWLFVLLDIVRTCRLRS